MRNAPLAVTATLALAALLPFAASAAAKPFTGPAGWDHTVQTTPTPQVPRDAETWKQGQDVLTLTSDDGLAYADIVGAVEKNIAQNALKPAMDKDRTCAGRKAHELEMTFGSAVVHQVIIDDNPGVMKLTYTRPQSAQMSADVTNAIAAYCGS